ncbi:MAG TPA: GntR family transcriptional regulator [Gammaproteobacteria bacterium]|jgi:DNA-binding GntR family transcriptional regulator
MSDAPKKNLAETVYRQIKEDIFNFNLLPGSRFTEAEVAGRLKVSRTPVREALFRLEREGYLLVHSRSGWSVQPFDFQKFENLYDLRTLLEEGAIKVLCEMEASPPLEDLWEIWVVPKSRRLTDWQKLARLDEHFHEQLVAAAGNPEITRVHHEVTERIRIIRRLDFTRKLRIENTYEEHANILKAIKKRKADHAQMLLRSHIEMSKAEVRKITIHMLHTAREQINTG